MEDSSRRMGWLKCLNAEPSNFCTGLFRPAQPGATQPMLEFSFLSLFFFPFLLWKRSNGKKKFQFSSSLSKEVHLLSPHLVEHLKKGQPSSNPVCSPSCRAVSKLGNLGMGIASSYQIRCVWTYPEHPPLYNWHAVQPKPTACHLVSHKVQCATFSTLINP